MGHKVVFFVEVSALLDVRHCPKLRPCAISRKTNDATLRKLQNPNFGHNLRNPNFFSVGFTSASS